MNLPAIWNRNKKTSRAKGGKTGTKSSARRKRSGGQSTWWPWTLGLVLVLLMAGVGLLKWSESRTGQAALLTLGSEKMYDEVQTAVEHALTTVFPSFVPGPINDLSDPWQYDWPEPALGAAAQVRCRTVAIAPDIPYRQVQLEVTRALAPVGARVLWAQRLYPDPPRADQLEPNEDLDQLRLDLGVPGRPTHTLILYREGNRPDVRWGSGPGVTAWTQLKARAEGPLVALVIDDWGYAKTQATRQLINLPVPLTMAVLPGLSYSREFALAKTDLVLPPRQLTGAAGVRQSATPGLTERLAAGCFVDFSLGSERKKMKSRRREILLHLPMQPENYPDTDPGPQAIMVGMDEHQIISRLDKALGQLDRVTGVNNHMGSAATSDAATMAVLMRALDERGLLFLDSLTSSRSVAYAEALKQGIPALRNRLFLDYDNEDEQKITAKLNRLVQTARSTGYAVGIGHPHPATARVLAREIPRLVADGVVFVTVSELHALLSQRQETLP